MEKSSIGADNLEGNLDGLSGICDEVEIEVAGYCSVEDAEAVLAGLNVEEGPWDAIDMVDISPNTLRLTNSSLEGSISIVVFGGENERDVELAISGGKVE